MSLLRAIPSQHTPSSLFYALNFVQSDFRNRFNGDSYAVRVASQRINISN
jgi:hypothetical protein